MRNSTTPKWQKNRLSDPTGQGLDYLAGDQYLLHLGGPLCFHIKRRYKDVNDGILKSFKYSLSYFFYNTVTKLLKTTQKNTTYNTYLLLLLFDKVYYYYCGGLMQAQHVYRLSSHSDVVMSLLPHSIIQYIKESFNYVCVIANAFKTSCYNSYLGIVYKYIFHNFIT